MAVEKVKYQVIQITRAISHFNYSLSFIQANQSCMLCIAITKRNVSTKMMDVGLGKKMDKG